MPRLQMILVSIFVRLSPESLGKIIKYANIDTIKNKYQL